MGPDTTIAFKGVTPQGTKKYKSRISLLIATNADGSDKPYHRNLNNLSTS
jgi:hypothetical protein